MPNLRTTTAVSKHWGNHQLWIANGVFLTPWELVQKECTCGGNYWDLKSKADVMGKEAPSKSNDISVDLLKTILRISFKCWLYTV